MTGGFREALICLASLTGDVLWAILGLLGIGVLLQSPSLQLPIAIAGSAYLGYLAWDSWKTANAPAKTIFIAKGTMSAARAGVILSTTNPQNIAYWAALGSAFAAIGIANPQPADFVVFFAGFMLSSILWCFFCAAIVNKLSAVPAQNGKYGPTGFVRLPFYILPAARSMRRSTHWPSGYSRVVQYSLP